MSSEVFDGADQGGLQTSSRSRFNAVTHGLTAKTPVLPGESAEAFQARIDRYKNGVGARNELEEELAERAALASWQADRAKRAEAARLTRNIYTEPAMIAFREKFRAAKLGQRLFFDRRGPVELYPSKDYFNDKQPRTSASDVADDPDDPGLIVAELETFPAGCQWLRERWGELRELIEMGLGWQSNEKFKGVRLLGRQPLNAVSVPEVREVFLACHVLEQQFAYAFQELRCEVDEDRFKRIKRGLSRRKLEEITPADATAARAVLLGIVDKATGRLRVLEAGHQEVANVVDALQTDILSVDDSKSGLQISRLQASWNRLILRNIDAIHKCRRNEEAGWGRTRQERERRKQDGRVTNQGDQRAVVDEHGSVRNAEGYDGDLQEGLARYEAKFGGQIGLTTEALRHDAGNEIRGVPDFARWVPPAADMVEPEPGIEPLAEGALAEPVFEAGTEGVEPKNVETLLIAEQGEGANIQNEIVNGQSEAQRPTDTVTDVCAQESPVSRRDDHVERVAGGSPRVPLSRREKKRRRREMDRKDYDRGRGGTQKRDASVDEMINSIKWILPNSAEFLRDYHSRSP